MFIETMMFMAQSSVGVQCVCEDSFRSYGARTNFFRELGYKHSAPTELKKHWVAAKAKGWLKNSGGLKTQRVK